MAILGNQYRLGKSMIWLDCLFTMCILISEVIFPLKSNCFVFCMRLTLFVNGFDNELKSNKRILNGKKIMKKHSCSFGECIIKNIWFQFVVNLTGQGFGTWARCYFIHFFVGMIHEFMKMQSISEQLNENFYLEFVRNQITRTIQKLNR